MSTMNKVNQEYIQVLHQVHPEASIASEAEATVLSFIARIKEKVAEVAQGASPNKTLCAREVQTAVRLLLPGELAKHAVSEGTKVITKFVSGGSKKVEKTGLIISIEPALEALKKGTTLRVEKASAIYLTGVLEYLSAEVFELAGNAARDNQTHEISNRHIYLAMANDEELEYLRESLGFIIPNGGVLPNIHATLLPKKADVDKKDKALDEIRKYQKETGLLLSEDKFKKVLDEMTLEYASDITYAPEAVSALQVYTESKTVEMLKSALRFTLHAGRKAMTESDIQLYKLTTNFHTDGVCSTREKFCRADIRKLGYRAGAKKVAKGAFESLELFITATLGNVVREALTYAEHRRVKEVSLEDVSKALALRGAVVPVAPKVEAPKVEEEDNDWEWEYYTDDEGEFEEEDESSDEESSDEESSEEEEEEEEVKFWYLTADSKSGGKFWKCEVKGSETHTTYGKIGNKGTTKVKVFKDGETATKEAEKTANKKLAKGYVAQ